MSNALLPVTDLSCWRTVSLLCVIVLAASVTARAQPAEPPRTAWGAPDLGGIWDFRTMTPLERPHELADTAVWSEEDAAEYRRDTLERRAANPLAPRSVHAAWWLDNGTELTADRRTSLIVDPPDGRIPALTPDAAEREVAYGVSRPVRHRLARTSPAHGPEDLGVGEPLPLWYLSKGI